MPRSGAKSGNRLAFIDWTRGFAALIMLQGHVFHSFTQKDLRADGPYVLSQFIGGITPAVFLFLTGVTLGFLMDSTSRKGLETGARVWSAFKRSGFLIAVALLFRLQMWIFSMGHSPWTDIFKVDILNCMAISIATLAPMAIFETRERIRFAAVAGLAIAGASPIISVLNWSWLHPFVQQYFVPNPNFFAYFPWAAFVAFGVSAGSVVRLVEEEMYPRMMQWAALAGIVILFGTQYFANLPYSLYAKSDFWINSPALILMKVGIILLISSFAFLWTRYMNPHGWSFVRQLGTTSLLVYWVHTELVYGNWLWYWKESLSVPATVALAASIIVLMIIFSVMRTGWKGRPGMAVVLRQQWNAWRSFPASQPATGD